MHRITPFTSKYDPRRVVLQRLVLQQVCVVFWSYYVVCHPLSRWMLLIVYIIIVKVTVFTTRNSLNVQKVLTDNYYPHWVLLSVTKICQKSWKKLKWKREKIILILIVSHFPRELNTMLYLTQTWDTFFKTRKFNDFCT